MQPILTFDHLVTQVLREKMRHCSKFSLFSGLVISLGTAAIVGCSGVRAPHAMRANAPGLSEDARLPARGVTDPNAPYMVVDHSARLVTRPALFDVNAVPTCAAENLSLFESGAQVDGTRRTVRLNLVNHAAGPCRLIGYPAISLLRPDGSLIGSVRVDKVHDGSIEASLKTAGRQDASAPSPALEFVLLAPAGEATFEVGWTGADSQDRCDQVGSIAVAAPGTLRSFVVHRSFNICQGRILVTAVKDDSRL